MSAAWLLVKFQWENGFPDNYPLSCPKAQELREIQAQINTLPDPQDPEQVVNLLNARREYMFLLLDVCLSSVLSETFLANGNEEAHQVSTLLNSSGAD